MSVGIAFVKRLIEAFLTGFAVAFGVNLFIFPVSSRHVVFKDMSKYLAAVQGTLKAEVDYMRALEEKNVFSVSSGSEDKPKIVQPTKDLKASLAGLVAIYAKLHGDMSFAKREIAYGNLCATDLESLRKLMKRILLPVLGVGSIADIFDRVAEHRGWKKPRISDGASHSQLEAQETRVREVHEWNDIFKTVHEPFDKIREVLSEALQHILYTLELEKRPKQPASDQDPEAQKGIKPGDQGFSSDIKQKIETLYEQRQNALRVWCSQKGIHLADFQFRNAPKTTTHIFIENETIDQHQRNKRQLYLILYVSVGSYEITALHTDESHMIAGISLARKWYRNTGPS